MLPILQIGPLALPVPALVVLAGIWIGLSLAERYATISQIPASKIANIIYWGLAGGLIGARLGILILHPQAFLANPLSIFTRSLELLDPWTGILVAGLTTIIYTQRNNLNGWRVLDALTPFLTVMAISLGLAHLASGTAFGSPTNLPWGIRLWGEVRHPSQIYEILAACLALALTWPGRGPLWSASPGGTFLRFVAWMAGSALFLEAFRGDSLLLAGDLRLRQVAAWIILAASLLLIVRGKKA